jgi:hypothetical protein
MPTHSTYTEKEMKDEMRIMIIEMYANLLNEFLEGDLDSHNLFANLNFDDEVIKPNISLELCASDLALSALQRLNKKSNK